MSEARIGGARTPWHIWVVGVISLLWNSFGAFDYTMTQLQGDAYLQSMQMTEPQIAYMHAMPIWMTAAWAIGVWGALAGSVLLLLRNKLAAPVFAASLIAFLIGLVYSYGLTNGAEVYGEQSYLMNGIILAGCLFFLWYAWTMRKAGVLR